VETDVDAPGPVVPEETCGGAFGVVADVDGLEGPDDMFGLQCAYVGEDPLGRRLVVVAGITLPGIGARTLYCANIWTSAWNAVSN